MGSKPFIIHVSARLGQPLGCFLLGRQEKIIHVEHIAAVYLGKQFRQPAFPAAAAPINGNSYLALCFQQLVNGQKHGGKLLPLFVDQPVVGAVGRGVRGAVAYRGKPLPHHFFAPYLCFLKAKGQLPLLAQTGKQVHFCQKTLRCPLLLGRCEGKHPAEGGQRKGRRALYGTAHQRIPNRFKVLPRKIFRLNTGSLLFQQG